ncbi:MAG: DUF4333 domain-containing protein [Acidobacteria bacterium]|nr:MAG: DUF4333 domain-containing protein [Acidobacteriota bacterium]MCL4286949.1 DUF4333 domain-containing protein [Thermoleophilia bacterium]GIK77857.1 MAG: hypothetical protein BroJett022_15470 [Actinomycetes bacterium]
MKGITKTIAAVAAAAALGLAAAGCGNTIDAADLEGQLADQLAPQANVDPADVSVDCPDDQEAEEGSEFQCTLTAPNGDEVQVDVTLTDDEGGYDAVVPPEQFE